LSQETNNGSIRPLQDIVIVESLNKDSEIRTKSGIIIPQGNSKSTGLTKGKIVSVGDGQLANGTTVDMSKFTIGSVVYFADWAATSIDGTDPKLFVVRIEDIKCMEVN